MEPQNKGTSDEIDLIYLFNKLVKNLMSSIKIYAGILLRNGLLLVSIFVFIAIIGFSLRYFLPRYFKTQAVYVAHYMPANMYALLLDDLSNLAASNNNASVLAEELKISEKNAATIHSIETQILTNQDFQYKNDTTAVDVFRVTLVLKDISGLKEIQNGIKDYLENNEYSIKRKNAKRKTFELMRADIIQKKKSFDSIQVIMNKPGMPKVSGQVIVLSQSFTPIEAFKMLQEYNTRQFQLEQELTMVESIEIVEPFLKINAPNTPDFSRFFRMSLLLALVLALIFTPIFGKR